MSNNKTNKKPLTGFKQEPLVNVCMHLAPNWWPGWRARRAGARLSLLFRSR